MLTAGTDSQPRSSGWGQLIPNPSDPNTVIFAWTNLRARDVAGLTNRVLTAPIAVPFISPVLVRRLALALIHNPVPLDKDTGSAGGDPGHAVGLPRRPSGWDIAGYWIFESSFVTAIDSLGEYRYPAWQWITTACHEYVVGADKTLFSDWIKDKSPAEISLLEPDDVRRRLRAPALTRQSGFTLYGLSFYLLAHRLGLRGEGRG